MRFNKLPQELKDLEVGLKGLDFINNFKSFKAQVTIPATSEVKIKNLLSPIIPSMRLIVRQTNGGAIIDGFTAWSEENVYLYNTGAEATNVTVIFLE